MIQYRLLFVVLLSCFSLSSCKKAADAARALLCTDGNAKGKMSVGLDFDFLNGILLQKNYISAAEEDDTITDDTLKDFLNDTLEDAGVEEDSFNVSGVDSVEEGDKFRFLEMGGTFGSGFGVATDLFQSAFGLALNGSSPFDFINESFNVRMATYNFVAEQEAHGDQWAIAQTNFDGAMELVEQARENNSNADDDPVIVAVLDTGVDSDHPDLKDIMIDGADYTDDGSGTHDENGHGTHCAGIIAGQAADAEGVLGVAGRINVQIMPIKVLGKSGGGGFDAIEKGIRYAHKNGADVISMSLGAGLEFDDINKQDNPLNNDIVNAAIDDGVIVVVAAGNEGCKLGGDCNIQFKNFSEYTVVPCAYENVICVGASNSNETLASYSNYSSSKSSSDYRTKSDINAPGTAIYSSWPTDLGKSYNTISGTSMATPFVAGVAALFKWADRSTTQTQFLDYITRTAAQPEDIVEKAESGRLDLYASSVALANEKEVEDAPEEAEPEPNPVDPPDGHESDGSNDGDDLAGTLSGAVCN